MNEKSFPVYLDTEPIISMLSDEQLGQLFRALYPYWNDGEMLVTSDSSVRMAFAIFANKLDLARASGERFNERQRIKSRIAGFAKTGSAEKENAARVLLEEFTQYRGSVADFQRKNIKAYEEIGIMIETSGKSAGIRGESTGTHGRPTGTLNITEYNSIELNPIEGNITEKGSGAESRPEPVSDSEDVYPWEKDLVE